MISMHDQLKFNVLNLICDINVSIVPKYVLELGLAYNTHITIRQLFYNFISLFFMT